MLVSGVVALLSGSALGEVNGIYGAPDGESYEALAPSTHAAYRRRTARLTSNEGFYYGERGRLELRQAAAALWERRDRYARIVSIGRSGTGILSYLRGRAADAAERARFTDLPFSFGSRYDGATDTERDTNERERAGLRAHLERNGLSPRAIAASTLPILIYDYVFTATGVRNLFSELSLWATELGIADAVRAKLHFFGYYPAEMQARSTVMSIYRATVREMWGSTPRQPPDEEEIERAAESLTPPLSQLLPYCAEVHWMRVSSALYHYGGTGGPTAHESFTRSEWTGTRWQSAAPTFAGRFEDPAFLALHYVYDLGREDRASGTCTPTIATQPASRVRNYGFEERQRQGFFSGGGLQ